MLNIGAWYFVTAFQFYCSQWSNIPQLFVALSFVIPRFLEALTSTFHCSSITDSSSTFSWSSAKIPFHNCKPLRSRLFPILSYTCIESNLSSLQCLIVAETQDSQDTQSLKGRVSREAWERKKIPLRNDRLWNRFKLHQTIPPSFPFDSKFLPNKTQNQQHDTPMIFGPVQAPVLDILKFEMQSPEQNQSRRPPWEPLSGAFRYYLTWLGSDGACDWWVWGCKGSLRDINITNVSTDSLVIMVHRCTDPAYSERVHARIHEHKHNRTRWNVRRRARTRKNREKERERERRTECLGFTSNVGTSVCITDQKDRASLTAIAEARLKRPVFSL